MLNVDLLEKVFKSKMNKHQMKQRYQEYYNYVIGVNHLPLVERIMNPPTEYITRVPGINLRMEMLNNATKTIDINYSLELNKEVEGNKLLTNSRIVLISDKPIKKLVNVNFNSKDDLVSVDELDGGKLVLSQNFPDKNQSKVYVPIDREEENYYLGISYVNPGDEQICFYETVENDPYPNPTTVYDRLEDVPESIKTMFNSNERDEDGNENEDGNEDENEDEYYLKLKRDLYAMSGIQGYIFSKTSYEYNIPIQIIPTGFQRCGDNIILFIGIDAGNNHAIYSMNIKSILTKDMNFTAEKKGVIILPWTKLMMASAGEIFSFTGYEKDGVVNVNVAEFEQESGNWVVTRLLRLSVYEGSDKAVTKQINKRDIEVSDLIDLINTITDAQTDDNVES